MDYQEFLRGKQANPKQVGFDVDSSEINPKLFLFQNAIVRWALQLGKAAIFAEVGLGKTGMQLEWAKHVHKHTFKKVLILAPLAVSQQTIREGDKFGIPVVYRATSAEIDPTDTIIVTNYERLDKFEDIIHEFGGIVLDESSILKSFMGKTKRKIIDLFQNTPYKLTCSATPAPNDHMELGNHAQFLDVMASNEMLARWFINDSNLAGAYRLKAHAQNDFWRWITSWAVCISKPKDLGHDYHMPDYEIPKLNIVGHIVPANEKTIKQAWTQGRLFPDTAPSSTELGRVKRLSLDERIQKVIELVETIPNDEAILIWCELNDEADALKKAFAQLGAVEVRGSDSLEAKTEKLLGFTDGKYRVLITKASIAGFGMNWQHCHHAIFFSLDFSFESFYQAKGRIHRYGQVRETFAHVIFSELEGNVISTLERKQREFSKMQTEMTKAMGKYGLFRDERKDYGLMEAQQHEEKGNNWTMLLGDCVERIQEIADNSVDLAVYSPPFANLYIYSDNEADMGNSADNREFFEHYKFLIRELYRATAAGRLNVVHCKDLPAYQNRDGSAGLIDFPGMVIQAHLECGWQYHSRVLIWKDPVLEMQKTKSHGLLHKNFEKEANALRQGMPDYLLIFRKHPLDGQVKVTQKREIGDYIGTNPPADSEIYRSDAQFEPQKNYSIAVWQRYASPVWFDIDQTKTLNFRVAKENTDERHICPLQLDVIARAVDLWSNKGDLVLSPFAGVGSEGYESLKLGRKFIGIELKESYFDYAVKYLKEAEKLASQKTLWDFAKEQASVNGDAS